MATITEEMNSQAEREKQEKRNKIELEARMKAYKDIESIRKWVKFFGIITIIGMIAIILGIV